MQQFVIIFRQDSSLLTEADLARRSSDTRAWAQVRNAAGHELSPRILDTQAHRSGPGSAGVAGETVTALLFLQAGSFAEAVDIATTHPGLQYGASIEVRGWAPPSAPSPASRS